MHEHRRLYLALLLLLFVVLAGVLTWKFVYTNSMHFVAGNRPENYFEEPAPAEPRLPPVRSTDPSRGNATDKAVTIVQFGDYLTPYGRALEPELQKVLVAQGVPVRLVWRDFIPPSERPEPLIAAMAARCAGEQGKFWDMHDALLTQPSFDVAGLRTLAYQKELNTVLFTQCMDSKQHSRAIGEDVATARAYDIIASPTLFINGKAFVGYMTADQISRAVWLAAREQK
ncbi:MAG: thioredoxin domain-containing protein [Patescibacteria group bacterium]